MKRKVKKFPKHSALITVYLRCSKPETMDEYMEEKGYTTEEARETTVPKGLPHKGKERWISDSATHYLYKFWASHSLLEPWFLFFQNEGNGINDS